MKQGTFTFSPISEKQTMESSTRSFVDLPQLLADYLGSEHKYIFVERCLEAAVAGTGVDNLYLLPAGRSPDNPSEVIASAQAGFLLEVLKPRYDFIVIDSPPTLPTADAMVMAPRTDGILLVVKSGYVERKIIKNTVDQIRSAGLPVLGAVLNQVDLKKEGYYRYYNKYYASDHG
jgi:capsular exopolysaccharide synthesis family protein